MRQNLSDLSSAKRITLIISLHTIYLLSLTGIATIAPWSECGITGLYSS